MTTVQGVTLVNGALAKIDVTTPSGGRPTAVASFGPNGTHWPADTPWPGDTAPNEVEVDCTWTAIGTALAAVSEAQGNAGTIIRVRPGALTGNGGNTSSTPVLPPIGNRAWTQNVLVVPRDGYGTVTFSAAARIDQAHKITWAGLLSTFDFGFTRTYGGKLAWSKFPGLNLTWWSDGLGLYEVKTFRGANENDSVGIRPYLPPPSDIGGYSIRDLRMVGCHLGPTYKELGSAGHTDTIQCEDTTSDASGNSNMLIKDTVVMASSSAGTIMKPEDNTGHTLDHCFYVALNKQTLYYPLGGDRADVSLAYAVNSFAGSTVKDSYFIGRIAVDDPDEYPGNVINSKISQAPATAPVTGSWTVDTAMASWGTTEMNTYIEPFDDTHLASIWTW